MFFACVAPAVTFGGLMGSETDGMIGAGEMLVSTAVCGVLYALFAGGPLIILGGIGPLLIFTIILYQLCKDMDLGDQFLGVYGWVGIWTSVLTIILAVTNASNLMRYFTRFTDEIFSALMSLIFIYKAIEALVAGFAAAELEGGSSEKALLAVVLAVGTFYIAMTLAGFRRSKYLFPWMREFLADFGPSIALGAMVGAAWWLGDQSTLDTLEVSGAGETARSGLMVDLLGVPMWVRFRCDRSRVSCGGARLSFAKHHVPSGQQPAEQAGKRRVLSLGSRRRWCVDRSVFVVRLAVDGCRHRAVARPRSRPLGCRRSR